MQTTAQEAAVWVGTGFSILLKKPDFYCPYQHVPLTVIRIYKRAFHCAVWPLPMPAYRHSHFAVIIIIPHKYPCLCGTYFSFNLSVSTVYECITNVCLTMVELEQQYVRWPTHEEMLLEEATFFFRYGMYIKFFMYW